MRVVVADFFVAIVIIIASLTLGNLLVRDRIIELTQKNKLILGGLSGILGCLLMTFNIQVAPDVIVDYRCIPIIIMGLYCSITAASLTAVIIGLYRILLFGFTGASVLSLIIALVMAVACSIIGSTKIKMIYKWVSACLAVSLIATSGFALLIGDINHLLDILIAFNMGLLVLAVFTYNIKSYILRINDEYYVAKSAMDKDYMTGLYNNRYFDSILKRYISETQKKDLPVSLLFIDIDYFKKVNDKFGHMNGDLVLVEFATLLLKHSREIDVVTRKGGEEFIILLADCGIEKAKFVAERIRMAIEQNDFLSDSHFNIKITASIGIACYPETCKTSAEFVEQADKELYYAKQNGRNMISSSRVLPAFKAEN